LEPFKQYHRMLDVAMVAAEVERRSRRLAAGLYGDPDIDKVIVVADRKLAEALAAEEAGSPAGTAGSDGGTDE
jgi:hypothetical protein